MKNKYSNHYQLRFSTINLQFPYPIFNVHLLHLFTVVLKIEYKSTIENKIYKLKLIVSL